LLRAAAPAQGQWWTAMKALFSSAIFGLVPVPPKPPCDTLRDSPGGWPITTEAMSEIQANGSAVKENVNYEASHRERGEHEAVGPPHSTKSKPCGSR
jgi:hypothetical protein